MSPDTIDETLQSIGFEMIEANTESMTDEEYEEFTNKTIERFKRRRLQRETPQRTDGRIAHPPSYKKSTDTEL